MGEFFQEYPYLLAVAIFFARILDVSVGTVRTILVFRSRRFLSAILGFFEVLIWLVAAGQVIQNLDTWYLAVSYAGGFAAGNLIGIWIESRLALGSELVRAVSENRAIRLADSLRDRGYSVTEIPGRGDDGKDVEVLLIVERRRRIRELLLAINESDPDAFWTTSDIKSHPILPPISRKITEGPIKLK